MRRRRNPPLDVEKFASLIEWIEGGPKPVFIGFGSIVMKNTEGLARMMFRGRG